MWLSMMVSYCRAHNVQPVLVSSPSPYNWNMARHNGVQTFANELGVTYVDLNLVHTDMGINWNADTFDKGDHLNYTGAVKVSRYFGKYLSETFELPDHRNDASYESWNASYGRYIAEAEK